MTVQWTTPAGLLFTATEAVSTSVAVMATGTNISYSLISGQLSSGLTINSSGVISGVPDNVFIPTTSTFVIRATDSVNVIDRTFSSIIYNNGGVQWVTTASVISTSTNTTSTFLPAGYSGVEYIFNNQWVDYPLKAIPIGDPTTATITYHLSTGTLPPGLSLSSTGTISGFVKDHLTFPGFASTTGGYDTESFDDYSYDPAVLSFYGTLTEVQLVSVPKIYQFSVAATDGYNTSTNRFEMLVINPDMLRADSVFLSYDVSILSTDVVPASASFLELPQFLNSSNFGIIRAGEKTDLDVSAYNGRPQEGKITYSLITTTNLLTQLPPDLVLDPISGHISGYVEFQPAYTKTYTLTVAATKSDYTSTATTTVTNTFTLFVQGNVYSNIEWVSDSDLGSIETQTISDLYVEAREISADYNIKYQLNGGALPSGLTLDRDGSITGQVDFNATGTYTFTVLASDVYDLGAISNTFTLSVAQTTSTQYTSIYARPFMNSTQRQSFQDFISNTKIFEPSLIYRYFDPNFGVQYNMKMYLEYGIEKLNLDSYFSALFQNFYPITLYFGDVKVAVAKDIHGNSIYEVIYVDVIDPLVTSTGTSVSLNTEINNSLYYPASIQNMRKRLESLILNDQYITVNEYNLPLFMRTPQAGQYRPPGYMPVIPLCYTLPGQSSNIVDRIKLSGFNFTSLNFEIDRIIVSSSLDNSADKYLIFERRDISNIVPEDFELFGPDGVGFNVGPYQDNSGPVIDDESGNILTDQSGIPFEGN